jgi:hypothetical protein
MPDGFVQLPPDSTGKKLRTRDRGVAGHDQVVDIAAWPTYTFWTGFAISAVNKIYIDIFNAAGSGKIIAIPKLFIIPSLASHTGAQQIFDIDRTSAVGTGGTVLTANIADTTDGALPAQVTARHAPTGGATKSGGSILQVGHWSEETLAPAALLGFLNQLPEGEEVKEFELQEGQGLRVIATAGAVATFGVFAVITAE